MRSHFRMLLVGAALSPAALHGQTVVTSVASTTYGTIAGTDSVTSNGVQTTIVFPDLYLEKILEGPATAVIGQEIAYTIHYGNNSPDVFARDIVITDSLPPGLEYVSAQPSGQANGSIIAWDLGDLAPGDTSQISLVLRVTNDVRDTTRVSNVAAIAALNASARSVVSAEVELIGVLPNQLSLDKTADVLEIRLGETAPYTLVVQNTGAVPVSDIRIEDFLPDGSRYSEGSAIGADSVQAAGRSVTFFVGGPLSPGATHTVRYQVALISAASELIENRAFAITQDGFVRSPEIVAWVRVRKNYPMETRGAIGKVWVDENGNGVQDNGEPGVAGVDIWTDDGDVTTSDEDGKFSYRNLRPGGHAFRLDPVTLPLDYRVPASEDMVVLNAGGWTTPQLRFRVVPTRGRLARSTELAQRTEAEKPRTDSTQPNTAGVHGVGADSATSPFQSVNTPTLSWSMLAKPVCSGLHDIFQSRDTVVIAQFESSSIVPKWVHEPETYAHRLSDVMRTSATCRLEIAGHSDQQQPDASAQTANNALSRARAMRVADLLAAQGIEGDNVIVNGYGDTELLSASADPASLQKNRRVELRFAATSLVQYEIEIVNEGDQSIEGLTVHWEPATDSAVMFAQDTVLKLVTNRAHIPAVAPRSRVVINGWSERAVDSVVAVIEIDGNRAAELSVPIGGRALPVKETFSVIGRSAPKRSPWLFNASLVPELRGSQPEQNGAPSANVATERSPAAVPTTSPTSRLELVIEPSEVGWPELTYALPSEWELVAGSSRIGGRPAPDPKIQWDRSGERYLYWHFGELEPATVTVEVRPVGGHDTEETVTVPALRSPQERKEDTRRSFIAGPTVTMFSVVDGTVVASDRIYVGVRGEPGAPVELWDGDSLVSRANLRIDGAHDFIGVGLTRGPHRLRVRMQNSWSQTRWDSLSVHVSGLPAALVIEPNTIQMPADGQTIREVRVRLLDRWGVPVIKPTNVTVLAEGVVPLGSDTDASSVGMQLRSDRAGWLTIPLRPGRDVGRGKVVLAAGDAKAEIGVALLPPIRPLMVTGVGAFGIGAAPDAFGAVTARGRLDDQTSVTLSVDSRRLDAGRQDFDRAFDPLEEAQYPILGDASEVRTVGASRYAVAARIERGFDWIAFGDGTTSDFSSGLELNTYRRALSAAMGRITTGPVTWRAFGTLTDQSLRQVRIRGAGISGPYTLDSDVSRSSEQIVIETRDRENPQRIVTRQILARFVDYEIDYETGTLLFKRPVPSTDANENPVFLEVTYESSGGGERRVVGGMRASLDATRLTGTSLLDSMQIGVTGVRANEFTGQFSLTGADMHLMTESGLKIGGEFSYAEVPDSNGVAGSVDGSLDLLDGAVTVSAGWMKIGGGFSNPSNTALRAGTEEVRGGARLQFGQSELLLRHELVRFAAEGVERQYSGANIKHSIGTQVSVQAAQVFDRYERGADSDRSLAGELKVTYSPRPPVSLWAEGRNQFTSSGNLVRPDHIGVGAAVKVRSDLAIEGRFRRVLLPDDDSYSVSNIGVRSNVGFGTQAYGSYQLAGGVGGRYNAALVGLNNRTQIGEAWTINALFERRVGLDQADVSDPVRTLPFLQAEEDYWSFGFGLELLPPAQSYRMSTRAEYRDGSVFSTRLFAMAGDVSINRSVALLSQQRFLQTQQSIGLSRHFASRWGLAFRPFNTNKVNVLTKFTWLRDTNPGEGGVLVRRGDEERTIGAAEMIWSPVRQGEIGVRYAVRRTTADRVREDGVVQELESMADFVAGRVDWDITSWFTLRSEARTLFERTSNSFRWDMAPSVGFRLIDGLEISTGYRFGDLRDPDFSVRGGHGAFVTFNVRVTETMFPTAAGFWRPRFR